jgi:hypothetical protein
VEGVVGERAGAALGVVDLVAAWVDVRAREHAVLDPAATVIRGVERLRSAPAISPRVTVSGHVHDVVTGLLETVISPAANSGAGPGVQAAGRVESQWV